jgi:anti-sigma regulatory factor (Ser/Thr protein kinase)
MQASFARFAEGHLTNPTHLKSQLKLAQRALRQSAPPSTEIVSALPHWVELLIPCTREAAQATQSFLAKLETDLSDEMRNTIGAALRELLLNAVEWGGELDPSRKVRVARMRGSHMLLYRVTDPGSGFSFKGLSHASIDQTSAKAIARVAVVRGQLGMRPGGFGIAMARAMADELLYNEAQNEVIFVKYLKAPADTSRPLLFDENT